MRKPLALLVIVFLAIVILIFLTNPQVLEKVWLYILGFIGYVIVLAEKGFKTVANAFSSEKKENTTVNIRPDIQSQLPDQVSPKSQKAEVALVEQKIKELEKKLQGSKHTENDLGRCTLTVLRYVDDGETTLGLMFLRNRFFAYTLEDGHRDEKIAGQTRIPSGVYDIGFSQVSPADSGITRTYQSKYPWFTRHIHIKGVPEFEGIYIHVGNTHQDTAGCILIADGINAGTVKALQFSLLAFERFYKIISGLLMSNETVTIQILNEDWFEHSKLKHYEETE